MIFYLFPINAYPDIYSIFILLHGKDNGWYIEIPKNGVNKFNLLARGPHDICLSVN